MKTINFTNGKNPASSMRRFAATMRELVAETGAGFIAAADQNLTGELCRTLPAIEASYPEKLRTKIEPLEMKDRMIIHNSPHYGNTDLVRLGDVTATVNFILKNPGLRMAELRTVVDTNTVGRDNIYEPGLLICGGAVVDLGRTLKPEERSMELCKVRNTLGTNEMDALRRDTENIELKVPKELMEAAIAALPQQPSFAQALRLINRAIHLSLLYAASDAVGQRIPEYVIDVPLSMQLQQPKSAELFRMGSEAAERKPPERGSPRLCGYVLASLALNPFIVKGGRCMHTYYEGVSSMLKEEGLIARIPPLVVMPEMRVKKSSSGETTIPTINQAMVLLRDALGRCR